MKCTVCGGQLRSQLTDLPFKVSEKSIIIVKKAPVLQCSNCIEYLIEDSVFAQIEELLSSVDQSAELEVIQFAA